jgi:hypothetical protein
VGSGSFVAVGSVASAVIWAVLRAGLHRNDSEAAWPPLAIPGSAYVDQRIPAAR